MPNRFTNLRRGLTLAVLFATGSLAAQAQNVGIGTTAPTQTLDVNGALRVRGLGGSDTRLPVVLPDGTLGVYAPVYGTTATVPAFPTTATGSVFLGGAPSCVAVSGTTAYVLNNYVNNTLKVFDISNPSAPVLLGSVAVDSPVSVAVSGTTAYVVNQGSNTLQVFNVATPSAPALLGSVGTGSNPRSVAVSGTTAYVVNANSSTLQVFNVATPSAPALLGSVSTGYYPVSVALSGATAYVVSNSLQAFSFPGPPRAVAVNADGSFASVVIPSGTDFVQNGTTQQASANFNISGAGTVGGLLSAGSAKISNLSTAGIVTTTASGNLSSATAASLDPTTASNGLTKTGSNFALGGTLTQAITVANAGFALNVTGTGTTSFGANVGIGTTTPMQKLDVNGNVRIEGLTTAGLVQTDASGNLSSSTTASFGTSFIQNQTATVQTGGFSVSGNGTVGGTLAANSATLASTLQINTADVDKIYLTSGGASGSKIGHGSGWGVLTYAGPGTGSQGFHSWYTSGASVYAEQMRLTTTGLGIGTSTPSATLEVAGYTKLDGPAAITGASVPGIATALFTGNLPTTNNMTTGVSLGGIATSRILTVTILALSTNGNYFPPNQATTVGFGNGYEYGYYLETASNTLRLSIGTNANNIMNSAAGAVKILVTYQQ